MKKILVIGSTVADIIINVDYLPTTAQDVHLHSQSMSLGGCAHNVSDMIRHFGAPYILYSPVGTGLYGDFVRKELAKKGIESPVPTPDQANGCCYCFVEDHGERTFIVDHGAEYLFYKEWFDQLNVDELNCVYICGLEIEDKTGSTIVDFLESSGLPVFFAPGPRIHMIPAWLMERIFALKPILHLNEDEVCRYTGVDTIEGAAAALHAMTGNTLIVTNGDNGAYYYDGDGLHHVPGVTCENVVDTIGAGDSHCGGTIAGLSMGLSMEEAIAKANIAAAAVVATKGALLSDEDFAKLGL
ncbi:MAG: carbohydrate kinase family protein [Firmicutes bacterium]|nr:carbohydrate kinase family protein [Bacillota bacterium]